MDSMKIFISTSKGLSYLNLNFSRPRAGLADYIINVATVGDKPTKIRIRGERETIRKIDTLAQFIADQMTARGDTVHSWEKADVKHLAQLLAGPVKLMSSNTAITDLTFVTDALK